MYKINRSQIYLVMILALFIHLTMLDHIKVFGARPDLILIAVVFFGLFSGPERGLEAGVLGGLLCDIFSLDFFGINALVLGIAGFVAGALSTAVFKESKKTQGLVVFFFTIFSMWLHFMLVSFLSRTFNLTFSEYFLRSVLPSSLYTAIVAIPIFVKLIDLFGLKELQGLL